jgi:tetratricopeptide (TPR) repeat protein
MTCNCILTTVVVMAVALLTACTDRGEQQAQKLLAEADSALADGRYQLMDSLLAAFDSTVSATVPVASAAGKRPPSALTTHRSLLLLARRFVDDALTDRDFPLADSLCRHYRHSGERQKLALASLIVGDIHRWAGNLPEAISSYREAIDAAQAVGDSLIVGWGSQCAGDLLFSQRMLQECLPYYRRCYRVAESRRDTLRMAYAAFRQGKAFTVENRADSAEWYYRHTIALAAPLPQADRIVPAARYKLCDLYIQQRRFADARPLLTRDALNDENCAYWHLGQGQLDSAASYLRQMLGQYGLHADADYLRQLAAIEQQLHHDDLALDCYARLLRVEDSLQAGSQTEEIRRVEAQCSMGLLTAQRDEAARHRDNLKVLLVGVSLALAAVLALLVLVVLNMRQKRRLKATQQQLFQKEFEHSPLCLRVKEQAGDEAFHLKDEEWQTLTTDVDQAFDGYVSRLQQLSRLSELEVRVCCLVKMGIEPSRIATLLCKSRSDISATRSRLYRKIHGTKGSSAQMDDFLRNF